MGEARLAPAEQEFPDIAGIDRARAVHALMGNRALFLELLTGFIEEFADIAPAVRADLAHQDMDSATRRLHTLRGNAGTLGAMAVMETAKTLEYALIQGENHPEAGLEALSAQMADLVLASAPWRMGRIEPPGDSSAPRSLPFQDLSVLAPLLKTLHNHDLSALNHFATLLPALRTVLDETTVQALNRAIQALRFEEALELLSDYDPPEEGGLN